MELYVGMDVSLKQTSICVVDGSGEIVSEGTVNSEPVAIAEFIEPNAGSAVRIGLETGPTTTWLWHELRALGFPVICIDARHAKAALSWQINKSDRWRRLWGGPDHAVRLVQGGPGQERVVSRDPGGPEPPGPVGQDQARSREPDPRLGSKNLGLVIGKAGGTVFTRRVATSSAAGPGSCLAGMVFCGRPFDPLLEVREKVRREIAGLYRKLLGPGPERRRQPTLHDRAGDRTDHRFGVPCGSR